METTKIELDAVETNERSVQEVMDLSLTELESVAGGSIIGALN